MKQMREAINTLMFRFTAWYVLSLLAIILFIGVCIIGAVSYFLIQDTKHELKAVEQKITDGLEETIEDWQEMLDEILYPDHANYNVEIRNSKGIAVAHSRGWGVSPNANDPDKVELTWLGPFQWNATQGLFLYDEYFHHSNGHKMTIRIQVQLNNIAHMIGVMIKVLSITGIFSMIIGSLLIYHLTRRNMRPLFAIMDAMRGMSDSTDMKLRIPVPCTPKELSDLAQTINYLLDRLEDQIEREKSFVSNASHELRTPLTAFQGHVQLIQRWGKQDPSVLEQSIQALDQESRRMQRLTNQLLTLARTGNMIMKQDKVNLGNTVTDAIQPLWRGVTHKSLEEHVDPYVYVLGDEEQLRQIAIILFENAIRYTPDGGSITIRVGERNGEVLFTVADSGIGIPKDDLDKIFDRFYRVDKARSRETGGTGLGLSIAKELVQNHGGEITVSSTLGVGSTFQVTLPVYVVQGEEQA
ncbi:HAMP domain-containing sensor histidine kinase [Paenibacillus guangzhouensis]|uniref:HAMP domain-containing sensor histidine kinase n=1 Tax=Paenibacillus guangzhouensis TaxID=1473112 RepID=UPI0012675298|nr:HAMP domain-containing sensor histidine kinase [Paenibacillus guangzhouensis]